MKYFKHGRKAFTLMELLVVVAIICALVSILMPSLNKAKRQFQTAHCGNNLRQLGNIFQVYANDWNDVIIPVGNGNAPRPAGYYGPYWYSRLGQDALAAGGVDYLHYRDSQKPNQDILRCMTAEEQLNPMWNGVDRNSFKFGLNGYVCGDGNPSNEWKFSQLKRIVVLAGDAAVFSTSGNQLYYAATMNDMFAPWPISTNACPPQGGKQFRDAFGGHNNMHLTNILFSDFHVELRASIGAKEWKSGD